MRAVAISIPLRESEITIDTVVSRPVAERASCSNRDPRRNERASPDRGGGRPALSRAAPGACPSRLALSEITAPTSALSAWRMICS